MANERAPRRPNLGPDAAARKAEREAKLAQAMRENLKRRKAQIRGIAEKQRHSAKRRDDMPEG